MFLSSVRGDCGNCEDNDADEPNDGRVLNCDDANGLGDDAGEKSSGDSVLLSRSDEDVLDVADLINGEGVRGGCSIGGERRDAANPEGE